MRVLILAAALLTSGSIAAQDAATAAAEAERLVQQNPSAANWQKLGLARYLQNRFPAAADAFTEALRRDPRLWPSHLFLGISRYRQNDFRRALASLTEADALAPANGVGRDDVDYWLGATQIALGETLQGLRQLERLLARSPSHAAALQLATETYAEFASGIWNRIAERSFASSAGQEVHGYALESEGNLTGALDAFQQARKLAPKRSSPAVASARVLLRTGAFTDAAAALTAARAIDPVSPEANLLAGVLAIAQGRFADAVGPLTSAVEWMPRDEEPLLALAQVWLSLKEPSKAVAAAQKAVLLDARSNAAHELLLAALATSGDNAGAAAEQQRWQGIH